MIGFGAIPRGDIISVLGGPEQSKFWVAAFARRGKWHCLVRSNKIQNSFDKEFVLQCLFQRSEQDLNNLGSLGMLWGLGGPSRTKLEPAKDPWIGVGSYLWIFTSTHSEAAGSFYIYGGALGNQC